VLRDCVLLDTGVLVGAVSERDERHAACAAALIGAPGRAVTAWPVIVEAWFLLRHSSAAIGALWGLVSDPALTLLDISQSELPDIAAWMAKYSDQRPDLADAVLVHLADRERISRMLTIDSDFFHYRTRSGRALDVLPGLIDP